MKTLRKLIYSIYYFFKLVFSDLLHLRKNRLGKRFKAPNGKVYQVFRETFSDKVYKKKEVTLIVAFRLKFIGSNSFFHWLFQRLCLLDTPLWVGFPGFKEKFWMVEPKTKDYLGIYKYEGKENALKYANYICSILRPVSTKNSVWYKIFEEKFEDYLKKRQV